MIRNHIPEPATPAEARALLSTAQCASVKAGGFRHRGEAARALAEARH
ncbi:hypothetical protein [Jannaschia formosa]|nr:hypothetical protein [Jannaschia formosa]